MNVSVHEMRARIARQGVWAACRWAAKRGVPIAVALVAVRRG